MTKIDRAFGLLLCALFGLIGGAISEVVLTDRTVAAQSPSRIVKAQRFELVDNSGNTVGIWELKDDGNPSLSMSGGGIDRGRGKNRFDTHFATLDPYHLSVNTLIASAYLGFEDGVPTIRVWNAGNGDAYLGFGDGGPTIRVHARGATKFQAP